jgi:hypothetical protein
MSNIELLPSQNNICGIEQKDKITYKYKCPDNKFCNYGNGKLGICEKTGCFPYNIIGKNIDIKEYDGSKVSRNKMTNICDRKISTNGKCGLDNDSTKCPNGLCCSNKGICGYDKESCIYISPYYSNNILEDANRNYFSNYIDVKNFQYDFIKQITNKYIDNNNFEISSDNKCGLDLEKEKIFKCTDNNYCDKYNNCSLDYNNYNSNSNLNTNLNLQNLDLDLLNGENFNKEYNKWNKNKEKSETIYNKYINNNLEISTNDSCGIDFENEKIFKCSDNKFCDNNNKCSTDYYKYNDKKIFDFNNTILKDYITPNNLKDLNPSILHGNKFNNEYNNWINTKKEKLKSIYNKYNKNNNFDVSTDGKCGIDLDNEKIFKCSNKHYCDQYYKCSLNYDINSFDNRFNFNKNNLKDINSNKLYYNDEIKLKDLNSNLIHGENFFEEYNKFRNPFDTKIIKEESNNFKNPFDCNNFKTLESFKTLYNKKTNNNLKILNIVKTNKIDEKTCDIKYNFEGNIKGQNSRRITFEYNPDIGYVCTNIDKEMSGLTTLDLNENYKDEIFIATSKNINLIIIIIYIIIFISLISLVKINRYIL